ncbi:MAG: glycosyltransferase [Bacteroidota bacterium]
MKDSLDIEPSLDNRLNLIAVLDWGLGHASRSLALAARLRESGERIYWASAGQALEMIKRETEDEDCFELPAYDIKYSTRQMAWNIAWQSPKLLRTIRAERKAIDQIVEQSGAGRLISDSRFGCYSKKVPSIFLSHQLRPIVPTPVQWMYRRWLVPFDAYWVPDEAGEKSLSGKLSAVANLEPVRRIGVLSRLSGLNDSCISQEEKSEDQTFDIGILLSGPEPQRTKLERELLILLRDIPGRHWLVRGLPNGTRVEVPEHVQLTQYANPGQVYKLLTKSRLVVCRSGYSTIMDLHEISHQDILLIPTPGQTEQIYLATLAAQAGWARTARQGRIEKDDLIKK